MRRILIGVFIIIIITYVISLSDISYTKPSFEVSKYYIENAFSDYQSPNVVTSIYLIYRYYDTLFEALMLMFSLIGVIYMSVHEEEHEDDKR